MIVVPFRDLVTETADIHDEVVAALLGVARRGMYVLGPEVTAFEREWARYCGVRHAVGVGTGLSAIELILRAYDIGPGDEVLVPAYTFTGTWLAVSAAGATPVCVDVDPESGNMDPEAARSAVGPRTVAILAVHLFGVPADMVQLRGIADSRSLLLFEDAAQAHGAVYQGRRCGSLGDAGAFSFYPTKNLGAYGDGGAVTTNSDEIADRIRRLRNYGLTAPYRHDEQGTNSRLDELQAAVLRVKLRHLDEANRRRREVAAEYHRLLDGAGLGLPGQGDADTQPAWHIFAVRHPERDHLRSWLESAGIATQVYYELPPHRTKAYRSLQAWPPTPASDLLSATSLALPCHPGAAPGVPLVAEAARAALNALQKSDEAEPWARRMTAGHRRTAEGAGSARMQEGGNK